MKKQIWILGICVFVFLMGGVEVPAETLFFPGSPEVDQLVAVYQEAGRVFPTTSYPVSKAELSRFASLIEASASDQLITELKSYNDQVLMVDNTHDLVSASGAASFEYNYRSQNVNFDPGLPTALQVLDFQRLFHNQLPLGALQLDYSRDSGFELGILARVEREYFMDPFHSTNLWESDPGNGNPLALENQDIMRGFLWYDFHPLQVEFGRDKIDVGPGAHSLYPSLDLPFLDMLRIRLPIGRLTGDLVISTLVNQDRGPDVTLLPGDPPFDSTLILMAMHRYEYAWNSVRVGIGALAVYARNGNAYGLGDLFPVFSWHQANIGTNHLSVIVDSSWAPLPRLVLQGQVGLQSLNLSGIDVNNQSAPTIPAAIGDIEYRFPVQQGLILSLRGEAGYTHYLWGNFSPDPDGNPDALARAIDRYYLDGGNVILPLTSPYGPGATWVELTAALHGIPWLDASVSARYFSRMTDPSTGAPVNLVNTAYVRSTAIEGAPHVDTWSIGALAAASPWGFLTFSLEPTFYVQIDNRNGASNAWLELSLGVTVHGKSVTQIAHDS